MIKILFLIHDLGRGGAEKVLVNLVNHMDRTKFDISVTALFGGGVNEQFLVPDIKFRTVFPKNIPGNSKLMKLLSPEQLHKMCVKEPYDIEVAFLEGPSARIISGCPDPTTKLVSWTHCTMHSEEELCASYKSMAEIKKCYARFDANVFVSESTKNAFLAYLPEIKKPTVLYNVNESDKILEAAKERPDVIFDKNEFNICSVGRLIPVKGFDRLINIHAKLLNEGYHVHTYILGEGELRKDLEAQIKERHIENSFTLLGYKENPYKYLAQADLYVCSSHSEGFSTAVTEALIVGTPVCTVDVSGMKELNTKTNNCFLLTKNNDADLYSGIRSFLDKTNDSTKAEKRKIDYSQFQTNTTVNAIQNFLIKS